jgi:NTE family protein
LTWADVSDKAIFKPRYPILGKALSMVFSSLSSKSLYDSSPLQDLVRMLLEEERLLLSGKSLRVGAVSVNSGETRYWGEASQDIADAVIASSAFPGFFEPVAIDGDVWTDGGIRDIAPIQQALTLGATSVDVVITSPEGLSRIDAGSLNVIGAAPRILDAMSEEIVSTDILIGELLAKAEGHSIRILRPAHVVQPDPLDFNQDKIQQNIEHGLEEARKVDWDA